MKFIVPVLKRGRKKTGLILIILFFIVFVWNRDSLTLTVTYQPPPFNLSQIKGFSVVEHDNTYNYMNNVGFPQLNGSNCQGAFASHEKNHNFPQKVKRISEDQIASNASIDCDIFRKLYGFSRYPSSSEEERKFPLAFIILLHKDFDQILYLLRAIYHPHNVYCLSVDLNAGQKFLGNLRATVKCFPNIFVSSKLEHIVYAGFARLQSDINCMKDLLTSPVAWRYTINMAGQQFPLRTNLEMIRILTMFNGTNDVEGIGGGRMLPNRFKFKYKYVQDKKTGHTSLVRTSQVHPPPPHGLEIVKGSAYGSFARAFVDFVVNSQVAKDFLEWCKSVHSPDEYFWSTLHHSKTVPVPGRYTGSLEKKKWISTFASWRGENSCATIRVRDICIFSPEDLPLLLSRPELFANKFYISHHPGSLHCLDQLLYNLTVLRTVRDLSFHQQYLFHKNESKVLT